MEGNRDKPFWIHLDVISLPCPMMLLANWVLSECASKGTYFQVPKLGFTLNHYHPRPRGKYKFKRGHGTDTGYKMKRLFWRQGHLREKIDLMGERKREL